MNGNLLLKTAYLGKLSGLGATIETATPEQKKSASIAAVFSIVNNFSLHNV
jgi:hypothetical protein